MKSKSGIAEETRADYHRFGRTRELLNSEVAISKVLDYLTYAAPDADTMLAKAGIQRWQLRQLELDDEVSQCIETRKDAACAVQWRLEPNQSRAALFLRETLDPFVDRAVRGFLDAVLYGYAVQEAVYAKDGARIVLDRINLKPMEWFEPKYDGTLRYYPDDGSGRISGIAVDPRKFFWSTHNASWRNPRGEALLSRLWFPVTWRREGWFMWLHFLETFGDPIVLGQVPNFQDFVEAMKAQGVRSTIAWQSTSDRDHVSTINASAPGEFERLELSILKRIQKLLLGQTLTSDVSGGGGSYAQAAIHNQVRLDKMKADIRLLVRQFQRLVDVLCELNGFRRHRFLMEDSAGLQQERATRDALLYPVLSGSGFKLSRQYFVDTYDYRNDDLEEVEEPTPEESEPMPEMPEMPDGEPTQGRSVTDPSPEGDRARQGQPVGVPKAAGG